MIVSPTTPTCANPPAQAASDEAGEDQERAGHHGQHGAGKADDHEHRGEYVPEGGFHPVMIAG